MKATLLIKNIENLYTCDAQYTVYQHAFIAMYHDKIIDLGIHNYKHWLDSATRVIDASGEIVVPAFIDADFHSFQKVRLGDQLREDSSALFAMRQNGILTLLTEQTNSQRQTLTQDVLIKRKHINVPIIKDLKEYTRANQNHFLLSCGFGRPNSYVYSLQPMTYMLFTQLKISSKTILQSMTSFPAQVFEIKDRGSLEVGKCADILVLQVPTIEHYFQTLGRSLIHRMIKNGIQFYPEWKVC